ncbi:MAG: alpha-keto acid decarboxylase family protein [Chloroflexi bacterium]|nr:alpha-keto acid decarboxylase family protein [Chloroflexota bacterium]
MTSRPYTVSDYLLDRLAELAIGHLFGVPGDYTLGLLDHVIAHPRVHWVGCRNELNAGYAADGYGRMRGAGALCTTFGVGELSAINAVTGSFAEYVPVIHIVGAPSSTSQAAHRIVHHSLGDGVFTHFLDMHASITCARAALTARNAAAEIDRVVAQVRDSRLPGYLLLPVDVAEASLAPPSAPLPPPTDPTDAEALAAFGDAAARLMDRVGDLGQMAVLAGLLVHRLGLTKNLVALLQAGALRHATSLWGKSLVDESNPRYLGIYAGAATEPSVRAAIEDAPVLVVAGVLFTDLNSGFFTQQITRSRTIELGATIASVGAATFAPVGMGAALDRLAELVRERTQGQPVALPVPTSVRAPLASAGDGDASPLSQAALWDLVAAHIRPGDVVLADQGTAFYGMATHRLPRDVTFLGQPLWASIGYTLPAALGACLAAPGRRGVVLIGDGAAHMTIQALSSILRAELPVLVVVVDNDGYTVERAIRGPDQPYNDIPRWEWTALPAALGAGTRATRTHRAASVAELEAALADADRGPGATLIQAVVPRLDTPDLLAALTRALSRANARG